MVLGNATVKMILNAFPAISKNLIQFLPTAIESFKHFFSYLTNSVVNPYKLSKLKVIQTSLFSELVGDH